jgi:hypothetical protein
MEDLSIQQTTVSPRVATPLVDDVRARYIEWRGACDALAGARAWANGEGADYFAELAHEECSAGRYAAAVRALQHLLWPERQAERSGRGRYGRWEQRCDHRDVCRKPSMSLGRYRRAPDDPRGDAR